MVATFPEYQRTMIKSWMIIFGITFLLAFLVPLVTNPKGFKWFNRLRRPDWMTFEKAIPIIWTAVFIGGAWSATIVWERSPGQWWLMSGYLLLELVTLAYSPMMMNFRSLKLGTVIGATGAFIGALLMVQVWQIAQTAAWLLVPYLLWSPIGTYTTWAMARLNPGDA
jgi:translocator protein